VQPQQKKLVKQAESIFAKHKAIKIAVLGSYGKTTMKELLLTVLSEGKRVSATPGNMNVSVSHARFAQKLRGDEEILIVEFGEGAPGDISRMAKMLQPNYAVVTGLAPNHLDHYASLDAVAKDLLSIYETVDRERVLVAYFPA
jgi:UDP-N-acetylmuramoyl-tripeptide--D-alanyl-D-alanine ligase